ncbi:MAG: AAA family ATPase, partial [Planctomycetota bacterium]
PENFVAPHEMRVQEYLMFRARLKGLSKKGGQSSIHHLAKRLGLEPRMRQPFSALSKGFRQRVGLADALLADPPALLLDEPFSGLDPLQRQEFRGILRDFAAAGKAILFSSHVLPEVEEIATRVQILNLGISRAVGTLEELQRLLQREASLLLRLESGNQETVASLKQGAEKFSFRLEVRGPERFLLHLKDPSMRPELFSWIAAEGLPVIEFREQRPDLDHLFRSLVEEAEGPVEERA